MNTLKQFIEKQKEQEKQNQLESERLHRIAQKKLQPKQTVYIIKNYDKRILGCPFSFFSTETKTQVSFVLSQQDSRVKHFKTMDKALEQLEKLNKRKSDYEELTIVETEIEIKQKRMVQTENKLGKLEVFETIKTSDGYLVDKLICSVESIDEAIEKLKEIQKQRNTRLTSEQEQQLKTKGLFRNFSVKNL